MRKKLDTRFPAARIKKIMQADEDVGKIAMAVPVLVSKALELFLQDLCDRTYDITLQRGAKTVSSLHLKHCVQCYNVFDFLREVVCKVPDYGHSEAAGDDANTTKRRKVAAEEVNDSDEESKRSRMHEMGHASSSGRGRGRKRRRGRGRVRVAQAAEKDASQNEVDFESCTSIQESSNNQSLAPVGNMDESLESKELAKENIKVGNGANLALRNFDLNADLDENTDKAPIEAVSCPPSAGPAEVRREKYGWSISEMDRMAIDPVHLTQLNSRLDEDDEDYDEEG